MARILFSCLLLITLCVVIESTENHHRVRRTVKHYKVPGQSQVTEDNDEETESPEIKSSSSSSSSSRLSPTNSFRSNGTPKPAQRVTHESNQNNVSPGNALNVEELPKSRNSDYNDFTRQTAQPSASPLNNSLRSNGTPKPGQRVGSKLNQNYVPPESAPYVEGLPKSKNSDFNDFTRPTAQPSASPLAASYPSFQKNSSPFPPANIFGSIFGSPLGGPFGSPLGGPFGSPLRSPLGSPFGSRQPPMGGFMSSPFGSRQPPMGGLMSSPFSNGPFGSMMRVANVVVTCCDNFNKCRVLKDGEVCGPEVLSSPSSSPSSTPAASTTNKSVSPNGSPEDLDHEHDENISPKSINNKNDIVPENKSNQKQQPAQLNPFNFGDFFKNSFGNRGLGSPQMMSPGKCCINGECLNTKPGEVCGDAAFMERLQNEPHLESSESPEDSGISHMKKMMDERLKQFRKRQFGSLNGVADDDDDYMPNTAKKINAQLGPMKSSKSGQSNIPANGMGSLDDMMKQYSNPMKHFGDNQSNDVEYQMIDPYANKQNEPRNHPFVQCFDFNKNELQKIRKQVLDQTNVYRVRHGVPKLTMDENMNNYAQEWANYLKDHNAFEHRTEHIYGENIFKTTDPDNFGEEAVNSWYNELALYDLKDDESDLIGRGAVQHLTQLLWQRSLKLGVGVAKSSSGYIVVANYDPPGNYAGIFLKNLPTFTEEQIENAKEAVKEANKRRIKWVRI